MDTVPRDLPMQPPALAASAASAASAAIEAPRPQWQVVHCGVARGVLYLTYTERGQAGITPAFATPAVLRACAAAGHPVAAAASGAAARRMQAVPISVARPGSGDSSVPPSLPAPSARVRTPPVFTPQALGGSLVIDARNDGDVPWRCSISFSWTSDDNPTGARAGSAQVTLAPRQMNRVVAVGGSGGAGGAGGNLRFVGVPSTVCNPVE